MTTIRKSALLPYSAEQMFALVEQVEHYAEFLPWCKGTQVLQRSQEGMLATIEMGLLGFNYQFTTQNTHHFPQRIELSLVQPDAAAHKQRSIAAMAFSGLQGQWEFKTLADDACKVSLVLEYQFASATVGRLIGTVFDQAASTLMDRFIARAEQVYS